MRNSRILHFYCVLMLLLVTAPALTLSADSSTTAPDAIELIEELGLREATTASKDIPGWHRPQKVVVLTSNTRFVESLEAVAPGVEIVAVADNASAESHMGDADVLIGSCSQGLLKDAPRLNWVQVYTSGVDRCVVNPGMQTGNKLLTNGQRISSNALAEHAIAMTLALARGLDVYQISQAKEKWDRQSSLETAEPMELQGRTLLVVGLGGIGTQTARRAHGLGMNVIATRGSRREGPDFVDYVGLADEVLELARKADVVVNTAPLTPQTRGMFNREFFTAMKPRAFFVSVGRGGSTVTEDLIAALKSGEIAGAGLDVTDPEPLPEGHELWTLPRVIISPHVGGRSDRGRERLQILVRENLRRYIAGEPMLSQVDVERGY